MQTTSNPAYSGRFASPEGAAAFGPENRSVNTNSFIQYMIRSGDDVKLILDVAKLLDDEG